MLFRSLPGGQPFLGAEMVAGAAGDKSYISRTAIDNTEEVKKYILKALKHQQNGHFSLVEVLSVCPVNWKTAPPATLAFLDKMKSIYQIGELKKCLRD